MARIVAELQELERARIDEALARAEERAREPAEQRPHGERGELGVDRVDPERAAGDLVLAQGLPGAPHGQPAHALGDERDDERQPQDDVIEKDRAVHGRAARQRNDSPKVVSVLRVRERQAEEGDARGLDAGIAVGQRHPVDEHQPDDLAEGERHDGEIIAAQAQHGKPKMMPHSAASMPATGRQIQNAHGPSTGTVAGITKVAMMA